MDTSAEVPLESLKCHSNELELYSGAANESLKGFQGRDSRDEEDIVDLRNICLVKFYNQKQNIFLIQN